MPERTLKDGIQTVTSSTFRPLVLEGKGPIAVEFMSYGCGHCKVIEPILQEVAKRVQPREKFFRVNIAADPELAERCEIRGTPTLVMFLDGNIVGRVEGPSPDARSVLEAVQAPYLLLREQGYANV